MELELMYHQLIDNGISQTEANMLALETGFRLLHKTSGIVLSDLSQYSDELMMGRPQFENMVDTAIVQAEDELRVRFSPVSQLVKKNFYQLYAANRTFYAVGEIRVIFKRVHGQSERLLERIEAMSQPGTQ